MISTTDRGSLRRRVCGILVAAATALTVGVALAGSSSAAVGHTATTHIDHLVVTSAYDTAAPVDVVASGTKPLTFSATATNDPVAPATKPVAVFGETISFTIVDSSAPPALRSTVVTKVTGLDGKASIVGSPTAATAGTTVAISATAADASSGAPDTASYADRSAAAGKLTIAPSTLTVAKGGDISATATVLDQFGDGVPVRR